MTGLGAYVLPGDLTWLERTLARYYPLLDELVVPFPEDGLGWSGQRVPAEECLEVVRRLDERGIVRVLPGTWRDVEHPMQAETAQRQAALDAFSPAVGWVLQIDNDELLPRPGALVAALAHADEHACDAVEWPMRVLFRRTRRHVLEVCTTDGEPVYEYPGPVAVRRGARLDLARRPGGRRLRVVVRGDAAGAARAARHEPDEVVLAGAEPAEAIVHNSWARSLREIREKVSGWGHARDFPAGRYVWLVWWPSPLTWRVLRDVHPLVRATWPRLRRVPRDGARG